MLIVSLLCANDLKNYDFINYLCPDLILYLSHAYKKPEW